MTGLAVAVSLGAHGLLAAAVVGLAGPGGAPPVASTTVAVSVLERHAVGSRPGPSGAAPAEVAVRQSLPGGAHASAPGAPSEGASRKRRTPGAQPDRPGEASGADPKSGDASVAGAGVDRPERPSGPVATCRPPGSWAPAGREDLASRRHAYALSVRLALREASRYPRQARRMGWEGQVVLRVAVDTAGRLAEASVVEPSDHDSLDEAALACARSLPTLPPPPGGPMEVVVPVRFSLRVGAGESPP